MHTFTYSPADAGRGELDPSEYHLLPAGAQRRLAALEEPTGHRPRALRLDDGYRILVASPRVELTMDWRRPLRTGRDWGYHSTLRVDGVDVPLCETYAQLAKVFEDPDGALCPQDVIDLAGRKPGRLPDLGVPETDPPALIENAFRALKAKTAKHGTVVELGFHEGVWQVLSTGTDPEGHTVHFYFAFLPDAHGEYHIGKDQLRAILLIDGLEANDLIGKIDLEALGLALPASPTTAEAFVQAPSTGTPGVSNAVRT